MTHPLEIIIMKLWGGGPHVVVVVGGANPNGHLRALLREGSPNPLPLEKRSHGMDTASMKDCKSLPKWRQIPEYMPTRSDQPSRSTYCVRTREAYRLTLLAIAHLRTQI